MSIFLIIYIFKVMPSSKIFYRVEIMSQKILINPYPINHNLGLQKLLKTLGGLQFKKVEKHYAL